MHDTGDFHTHSHGFAGAWFVWAALFFFFFVFLCFGSFASWGWGSQHNIRRVHQTRRDKNGNVIERTDWIVDEHTVGSASKPKSALLNDYPAGNKIVKTV